MSFAVPRRIYYSKNLNVQSAITRLIIRRTAKAAANRCHFANARLLSGFAAIIVTAHGRMTPVATAVKHLVLWTYRRPQGTTQRPTETPERPVRMNPTANGGRQPSDVVAVCKSIEVRNRSGRVEKRYCMWNEDIQRMPNGIEVIVALRCGNVVTAYRDGRDGYCYTDGGSIEPQNITHWQMKPSSPTCRFLCGTHNASWIYTRQTPHFEMPLFVAMQRLPKMTSAKRDFAAVTDWGMDSGAFTELQYHGRWRMPADQFSERVMMYEDRMGRLLWASPQDWMCEPIVISGGKQDGLTYVGTGKSVLEHQELTVQNYLDLKSLKTSVIPVLQGFTEEEYHGCIELYESAGVDLTKHPVVGVGSVCRRKNMPEARRILQSIADRGISPHGYGLAKQAVKALRDVLVSADSLAWSRAARYAAKTCDRKIKNCANCYHAAAEWWQEVCIA